MLHLNAPFFGFLQTSLKCSVNAHTKGFLNFHNFNVSTHLTVQGVINKTVYLVEQVNNNVGKVLIHRKIIR